MIGWIKKLFTNAMLANPEPWLIDALTTRSNSGVIVNQQTALKVSAVYACVRVIAESVAQLPLNLYRRTSDDGREIDRKHPLHSLLHDMPNSEQTAMELHDYTISRLLLQGTAYTQIARTRSGRVGELVPMTGSVDVDRDALGRLVYLHTQLNGSTETLNHDQVWRVTGFSLNGITGLSPIGLARESIGLALVSEEHGARMFQNRAVVPQVLESPAGLSEEAFSRLKESLAENHGGVANTGKTMILEEGLQLKSIGLSNVDAQFLENKKYQAVDITRWYRVPPHMIGELDNATFSNIEHQAIQFLTHTLSVYLVKYRQSIYRDLLTPQERAVYFADFVVDGLLRADITARNSAYAVQIQNGIRSRNEVRKIENLNPIDGLDVMLSPGNLMSDEQRKSNNIANFVTNAYRRVITKETQSINSARKKHSDEDFKEWLVGFYVEHVDRIVNELNVTKHLALSYCNEQRIAVEGGNWNQGLSDNLLRGALDEN